jgi:arylsulfatase
MLNHRSSRAFFPLISGEILRPSHNNLRTDPYERADITSNTYYDWLLDHAFLLVPAQDYVGQFLATFKDYPQRQKAASFNVDEVLAELKVAGSKD